MSPAVTVRRLATATAIATLAGTAGCAPVEIAGVEMLRVDAEPHAALAWVGPTFVVTFERGQEVDDDWLRNLARATVRSIVQREV